MDVRSVVVRLGLNTSDYARGAGSAVAANERIAGSLTKVAAKGLTTEKAMDRIGRVSGKAFLTGAAGIGYAEKKAADFNAEMATVNTLAHANAQTQRELADAAKTVGVNIGYSATDSARAEEELVKAGVRVKDILGGGLKGALDLAAAGQTDVATATEVAASAMTQFKLKGKDVPHIADLLAAGADKALGSVTDLGYGLSQVGTTANQMGFSIEETTGTLAEFAQSGLIGEKGGSTLKQMFLQLASPTKNAQKLMDQYGVSLYKANGEMKSMPEIADNLHRSFSGLTPAQRNYAMGVIFGSRAIQGANILMRDGEKVNRRWINSVDDQGFAAHQAAGKMNSLNGDVSKLHAQFDNAFINSSGKQNFLRELVQDGTKLIRVYNNLSDSQRGLVNTGVVRGTELAGAVYAATKIYKLAKSTSELFGWATGRGATRTAEKALGGAVLGKATKGVTPVFVTNPGFGKGPGGAATAGGSRVRRQAERNAASTAGKDAAETAAGTTTAKELAFVASASKWLAVAPYSVAVGGPALAKQQLHTPSLSNTSLAAFGGGSGKSSPGLPGDVGHDLVTDQTKRLKQLQEMYGAVQKITKVKPAKGDSLFGIDLPQTQGDKVKSYADALGKIDDQFAKMAKTDPGATWRKLGDALQRAGIPMKDAATLLPKTAAALGPAALAAGKYSAVLHTIPKEIRSYVSNPGAPLSMASMRALRKEYDLTPRQIRTIMELHGFNETQIRIIQAGKAFRSLPKAVRTQLRQEGGVATMYQVKALQKQYHLTPAQVRTLLKIAGVEQAKAYIHAVQVQLAGLHDKTVTIHVQKSGGAGSAAGGTGGGHVGAGGPGFSADGSTVPKTGLGYADRHAYLLADGEEITSNRRGQADRYRPVLKAINADLPRDQIRAMLAGGGTTGYRLAAGGTTSYATGPGVSVTFPAPAVYDKAVAAANAIATAGAKYAASAADVRAVHLGDLQLQQSIHETQKSLAERNDKTVGKGKHKKTLKGKGGYTLTGIDRTVAAAELADYQAQLREYSAANSVAQAAAQARQDALDALTSARTDAQTTLTGATDLFARGASGTAVLSSVNRDLRDISQYGQNIASLKGKGASAALLSLVKSKADGGDFASANKLAKSILESPVLLGQFNAALGARDSAAAAVANITTDPRFLGAGAWNPTAQAPQVVQFQVMDPTPMISEVVRQSVHIIRGELVNG